MPAADIDVQLTDLAHRVLQGELSADEALQRARQPAVCTQLTDAAAIELSRAALRGTRETATSWRVSVTLQSLLLAAYDARTGDAEPQGAAFELTWNWLGIASMALWHVPDPSLYRDALARGERATAVLRQRGDAVHLAQFLHALGTLHLDPYAAMRNAAELRQELGAWSLRAFNGETWNGRRYGADDGFPTPADALTRARAYYAEAAALKQGRDRGRTLKALAQALHAHLLYDLELDRDALLRAAQEASQLLDPVQDAPMVAEVAGYLRVAGVADAPLPETWLSSSLDDLVGRYGAERARLGIMHTGYELVRGDAARSFRLLADAEPLFRDEATHEHDPQHAIEVLRAFQRMHGFEAAAFGDATDATTHDLARQLIERAEREEWDPARLAAAALALAEFSITRDDEEVGLRLLEFAQSMAPLTMTPLRYAVAILRVRLLINEAVNGVHREDWEHATHYYSLALAETAEQRAGSLLLELLDRLTDVVRRAGATGAATVAALLFEQSDLIENIGGEQATQKLQQLYCLAVSALLESGGDADALWTLVQLAKGRRFAAMLAAGSAHRFDPRVLDATLLERIAHARAEAGTQQVRMPEDLVLLSPYSRASLALEGATAAERRANLEHAFDIAVHEQLARLAEGSSGLLATEYDVRAALGEETVLLQYYFPTVDAAEASYLLTAITTSADTRWSAVRLPRSALGMRMSIDGVAAVINYATTYVSNLRATINEEPGSGPLSERAAQNVADTTALLLAPIAETLRELRAAGRTHLCIAPHGALAYAPLHLLGELPHTLADDWTVTYLPNLELLSTHHGGAALRRSRPQVLAAFGLSFTESDTPIPEAVTEASAVAAALATEAVIEREATETAVIDALRNARCIHIATHGVLPPTAPVFQTLELAADADGDGHLYAYELLGLDLRGVDLVTLSACDTALGRFDLADNPHGLAATLFLAGVRTIIGTLWEVESNCSEYFFTTLYRHIAAGGSKRAAFRDAQRQTREAFPQLRDWGAFYFAGEWL